MMRCGQYYNPIFHNTTPMSSTLQKNGHLLYISTEYVSFFHFYKQRYKKEKLLEIQIPGSLHKNILPIHAVIVKSEVFLLL